MLTVVLVPRYLGDVAYGQAYLGTNLGALIGPICTLGLLDYLTRSLSAQPKKALGEATQAWVVMTVSACLGALALAAVVFFSGLQLGSPFVLLYAMGAVVLTPTQGLLLTVLRGHQRMGLFAAVNSIGAAACSLVPIIVLVAGGGLAGFALTSLLVSIVAVAVSWWKSGIRLPRAHISPALLLRLIPAGLPFLGWTLTMQFYGQINGILLGVLAPVQVVGWYGAAGRIIGIPMFVPMLIVTPLLPALTRCRDDVDAFRHTLNTSLRATLMVSLPFCAATAAAAPAIPHFLGWPSEFAAASVPMTILAPQLTVVALDMLLGTALIALGLERKWLIVGLVACVVSPTLNLIAIPVAQSTWDNGGIGAAAASIVTECVMLTGALVLLPRGILDRAMLSLAVRIIVAAVPFVALTRLLLNLDLTLPIALVLGGLIFVAGALVLRVVTLSEVRDVQRLGTRLLRSKLGRAA
jgi:O-antigen/teichoic acid export membrane protein